MPLSWEWIRMGTLTSSSTPSNLETPAASFQQTFFQFRFSRSATFQMYCLVCGVCVCEFVCVCGVPQYWRSQMAWGTLNMGKWHFPDYYCFLSLNQTEWWGLWKGGWRSLLSLGFDEFIPQTYWAFPFPSSILSGLWSIPSILMQIRKKTQVTRH